MYFNISDIELSDYPQLPAPNIVPRYTANINNAIPSLLKNCIHSYIYVWMKNNTDEFWMYINNLKENLLSGYCWNGEMWEYKHIYLNYIDSYY